jgi:hypothetical protein
MKGRRMKPSRLSCGIAHAVSRLLRQRVGHGPREEAAAVRPDHDAADVVGAARVERPDDVHVLAVIGEVGAVAAVDAAPVDEQRLVGTAGIS